MISRFKNHKAITPLVFVLNKYKYLSWNILPNFYKKIPKLLWGGFAVFGIFSVGFLLGIMLNDGKNSLAYQDLEERNSEYMDLIEGYEDLSNLYKFQGQNVGVIMDISLYETNPEEVLAAVDSIKEYKDKILIQQGRILELRHRVGLIE